MPAYKSVSPNPFTIWKRLLLVFVLGGALIALVLNSVEIGFLIALGIAIIISVIPIWLSYSKITRKDNTIILKNNQKQIHIDDFIEIKTWWNYDFGASSFTTDKSGESRMHANNINCYVKFIGKNDIGFIYEQIVVSNKFPNHMEYSTSEIVDEEKLVKVWDIDKCLLKLGIEIKNPVTDKS